MLIVIQLANILKSTKWMAMEKMGNWGNELFVNLKEV